MRGGRQTWGGALLAAVSHRLLRPLKGAKNTSAKAQNSCLFSPASCPPALMGLKIEDDFIPCWRVAASGVEHMVGSGETVRREPLSAGLRLWLGWGLLGAGVKGTLCLVLECSWLWGGHQGLHTTMLLCHSWDVAASGVGHCGWV